MNKILLQCDNLCKRYQEGSVQTDVLHNVSFSVGEGEMMAIVGSSGSGKSTLLHLLGGLDTPTSGDVIFNGQPMSKLSSAAKAELRNQKLGFIYQFHHLLPDFTALENVAMPLLIGKKKPAEINSRALEMLKAVGLEHRANHRPSELSGGERQRVAIARALATDPKVLLCDEATSALDPNTTHAILQLIQKINRELGITVVIITHQMSVVEEVCNRVAILDNGTVVEEGEVQAIFSHPTSKAARRLVYPAGAPQAEPLPGHKLVRVAFGGTQTTDKPLVASLAIECGALVSIMAADTRIVNGQTLGSMLLALPEDEHAEAALEYIKNYPGITYEEVNG